MNTGFIDWISDLKPSELIMFGNAYGHEMHQAGYFWFGKQEDHYQDFKDWLLDIYNKQKEVNKC